MRDIEFRGKLKSCENAEWIYGLPHHCDGQTMILSDNVLDYSDEYEYCEYWYLVDETTIGQYSGRKDKNGVKIYEFDRVESEGCSHKHFGTILFGEYADDYDEEYHIGWHIDWDNRNYGWRKELPFWTNNSKIEVVGNIFDNE